MPIYDSQVTVTKLNTILQHVTNGINKQWTTAGQWAQCTRMSHWLYKHHSLVYSTMYNVQVTMYSVHAKWSICADKYLHFIIYLALCEQWACYCHLTTICGHVTVTWLPYMGMLLSPDYHIYGHVTVTWLPYMGMLLSPVNVCTFV